ncbi:PLP-dependent transferase [Aaosphaeria arxii CBS 175.79]|uniref:PLP-dependent transferase n=1 Tax=Aaosphaeria arxii CBS 175.79 TaxID=1450172 RepID=A0A6A5Y9Y5_9PLEO|nr:PLP-dependent transferase [Aaosphaeria arxii CBS 175.79]KAF2022033.1 PLP-dependent transferase [Aaosphaeria arxii CBS 175.79]
MSAMVAPSLVAASEVEDIKLHVKSGHTTIDEALTAARARFVERNPNSLKLHEEAVKSLPGGNTRTLLHNAPFPAFIKSGRDYQVTSEDGHTYSDFVGEMTAGLYGHSQPAIQSALISVIQEVGLSLGGTTKLESQHAALLCSRFRLDRIRFTNSGTEATLHAIAGAKAYTGRSKVVVFTGAYHGACFMFPRDVPTPNVIDRSGWIIAEYNDVEDARRKIEDESPDDVAAVLIEGMQGAGPCIVGRSDFLLQVQASARKIGAVFILDEVMTSRLAPGGLQELEGLRPDLTTMGKYLGGGVSFGAFGGREDVMRVYDPREGNALAHSGTFNNNTLSMMAGHAGLSKVYTPDVAREFNSMGDSFRQRLQAISQGTKLTVTGRGSLLGVHFLTDGRKELNSYRDRKDDEGLKELFWLELMEDGFWLQRRGSISLMLPTPKEEIDRFVHCVEDFLTRHASLVRLPS